MNPRKKVPRKSALPRNLPTMYSPLRTVVAGAEGESCSIPLLPPASLECTETFLSVGKELARDYARNVWMLVKPTVTLMVLASLVSATLLVLIPWDSLLAEVTPLKLALVSI